ncbi:MAG: DUF4184 family protein [Candidatus Lokiarchaeota archaeon]|nr:DUF4184 family protein [Candidatus Lokiarchaeota archaeon]MBD3201209.1 DUF4184 family protein [Candidatus Lokiarchaeota archaeon]
MPSSIFSHQAPALLIKLKYPNKFDGTALCLSTIIPDLLILTNFFIPEDLRSISHSLLGQFIWTLPMTLISTIIFSRYLGPLISRIASVDNFLFKPLAFFGLDNWNTLKRKKFNKRFFIIASYSAIIGGLTHLLLDLPSHGTIELFSPWLILKSPSFLLIPLSNPNLIQIDSRVIDATLTVYRLIWFLETIIFFFISLYLLRLIKTKSNRIEIKNSIIN